MSKLILRYNDGLDTIELKFKNSELQGFLSNSLSQEKRIWNAQKRVWVIVPDVLHDVIAYSRHLFNHIDCSSLPIIYQNTVQNVLSGKLKTDEVGSEYKGTEEGLYSKLYLLPTAPTCVTKAVYKLLVKRYHPDGSEPDIHKFRDIHEAYSKIKINL